VIAYASGFAATLYFGFSYVLKRIKPTVFASFVTLQPLLTSILAYLFLDESFGWHQLIGAVLVISGLFIVVSNVDFGRWLGLTKKSEDQTPPAATPAHPKEHMTIVVPDTD
jgi:drug/metabolite transporter (DMT)-like permease